MIPLLNAAPAAGGKTRDVRLDLIRALAGLLVVSVHFFWNNGYYETPIQGWQMAVMTVMRDSFMVCVPLFLLLTGYLCCHKRLSRRYYLGLAPTLATYLLASLFCLALRGISARNFSPLWMIREILAFTAAPYGWYIELYIGLFLLIPFLNVLYHGLGSRRQKEVLLLTLVVMTALPAASALEILPDWWMQLFPVTYYMAGAYIREYQPRVDWRWALPLLVVLGPALGAWDCFLSRGGVLVRQDHNGSFGPTVMAAAVLLFLLLRQLPVDRTPRWASWVLTKAASLTLGIYLTSYCFDRVLHSLLSRFVPHVPDKLPFFLVLVPISYLCSAVASQVLIWIQQLLFKAIPALRA